MVTSQSCGSGHQSLAPGESKPGRKKAGVVAHRCENVIPSLVCQAGAGYKMAGLLGDCRVKSPRHAVVAQLVERQSSKLVIFCAGSSPVHRSVLFSKKLLICHNTLTHHLCFDHIEINVEVHGNQVEAECREMELAYTSLWNQTVVVA